MAQVDSWSDAAWEALRPFFSELGKRTIAHKPSARWTIGHHESAAFPFTAFMSLTSGAPGDEDVVLSVGVQAKFKCLVWTSDIATGKGIVLADGPVAELADDSPLGEWLGPQLLATIEFFHQNEALVARQVG